MTETTEPEDLTLTNKIIEQVIEALPDDEFDSHEFLRKLMTIAPRVYVNQLKVKLDAGAKDPIKTAHSDIAQRLGKTGLLDKIPGRHSSMNVRGPEETENQLWRKRKQP